MESTVRVTAYCDTYKPLYEQILSFQTPIIRPANQLTRTGTPVESTARVIELTETVATECKAKSTNSYRHSRGKLVRATELTETVVTQCKAKLNNSYRHSRGKHGKSDCILPIRNP